MRMPAQLYVLISAMIVAVGTPMGLWAAETPASVAFPARQAAATTTGTEPSDPDPNDSGLATDSVRILEEARRAQRRFERTRIRHLPRTWTSTSGECHERVGLMCFWHDDDNDWQPDPEAVEITRARDELLDTLAGAGNAIPGDGWITGQRVHYLVEAGRAYEAVGVVRECRSTEPGWCDALRGLTLHRLERFEDSERAFRAALETMDTDRAEEWTNPKPLLGHDDADLLQRLEDEDRTALVARLWTLADPYYLVRGNDRWTEHLSRQVSGRIQSRARNPHGIAWSRGLDELAVRYGHETSWLRSIPRAGMDPSSVSVVGRHLPKTERYMPPDGLLSHSTLGEPASWGVGVQRPRSAYAPSYAPDLATLHTQIARFRSGDSIVVVGAFRLRLPEVDGQGDVVQRPGDQRPLVQGAGNQRRDEPLAEQRTATAIPTGGAGSSIGAVAERSVQAGLFLFDANALGGTRPVAATRSFGPAEGVLTATVPLGSYLVSVEALDRDAKSGGRVRGGLAMAPYLEDIPVLSDLLLIDATDSLPRSLDTAIAHALPSLTLAALRPVGVAWEVYGLSPGDEELQYRITVEHENRSALRRAGEWLRLLGRDDPVLLEWSEPGPGRRGAHFRAVELDLRNLDRGSYLLRLELQARGRSTIVATRRFEVMN